MPKTILLFGAGKSATVLINYLLEHAASEGWQLVVVDANLELAQSKIGSSKLATAICFDVRNEKDRATNIAKADIIISLLPPSLHILVAKDCILHAKNLLTASYVDDSVKALANEIKQNNLLFLYEMGLDPGIDHMSAKKIIDEIKENDGVITSFVSHCGGLIAQESDDNPWHYKISWNPANIVHAGKGGARFKKDGDVKQLTYEEVFQEKRYLTISEEDIFCWYPNRDSLEYINAYELKECPTLIRTTLRHPDFMYGWKNIIDLKLTDESIFYETDGMTLMDFFKQHMDRNHFSEWLEQKLQEQFKETQSLLNNLVNLVEMEEKAEEEGNEAPEEFMMVNEKGGLQEVDIDDLKNNAAATIAFKMHESKLTLRQLFFLGMNDSQTYINKGRCSAADVLKFAMEHKMSLQREDKDLVIMLHEIEYEQAGRKRKIESLLKLIGEDEQRTAMAKTVGLPLGIAAKLILNEKIDLKGLHIPVNKKIYDPVLEELNEYGIRFTEENKML